MTKGSVGLLELAQRPLGAWSLNVPDGCSVKIANGQEQKAKLSGAISGNRTPTVPDEGQSCQSQKVFTNSMRAFLSESLSPGSSGSRSVPK